MNIIPGEGTSASSAPTSGTSCSRRCGPGAIPYYTILYYTILYYTILYYTILCDAMLYYYTIM